MRRADYPLISLPPLSPISAGLGGQIRTGADGDHCGVGSVPALIPIHKAFERTKATPGLDGGRHSAHDDDDDDVGGGGGGGHEVGAAVVVPLAHFGGSILDELTCPSLSPCHL